jgi:hypothetical protein
MNWYARTREAQMAPGDTSNSMEMRHLTDVVDLGLSELGRLPAVPSRWARPGPKDDDGKPRRGKRRREKRRRLMEGREPASQQANLPTDAVGNAPEGTGRMGL